MQLAEVLLFTNRHCWLANVNTIDYSDNATQWSRLFYHCKRVYHYNKACLTKGYQDHQLEMLTE